MKQFEFTTLGADVGAVPPHMLDMGMNGWELVAVSDTERGVMMYFKRELASTDTSDNDAEKGK